MKTVATSEKRIITGDDTLTLNTLAESIAAINKRLDSLYTRDAIETSGKLDEDISSDLEEFDVKTVESEESDEAVVTSSLTRPTGTLGSGRIVWTEHLGGTLHLSWTDGAGFGSKAVGGTIIPFAVLASESVSNGFRAVSIRPPLMSEVLVPGPVITPQHLKPILANRIIEVNRISPTTVRLNGDLVNMTIPFDDLPHEWKNNLNVLMEKKKKKSSKTALDREIVIPKDFTDMCVSVGPGSIVMNVKVDDKSTEGKIYIFPKKDRSIRNLHTIMQGKKKLKFRISEKPYSMFENLVFNIHKEEILIGASVVPVKSEFSRFLLTSFKRVFLEMKHSDLGLPWLKAQIKKSW